MQRNFGFTFGRTPEGRDRDYAELEKRLAQQITPPVPDANDNGNSGTAPPAVTPPTILRPAQTNLQFWTIPNVNYRGSSLNVDILKTLFDNGAAKTQDEWAGYSENARTNGGFYTPDYPLFYNTLERAFDLKDESLHKAQVEEMRTVLKGFSRAKWLMTLTRVKYSPKGKDKIVHNFGLKDQYTIPENFVGADGELPAGSPTKVYQSLLGTKSPIDKIKNVFSWLNETPVYIWRLNDKPETIDERVARFGADSGWADLGCDGNPSGSSASLGVRVH